MNDIEKENNEALISTALMAKPFGLAMAGGRPLMTTDLIGCDQFRILIVGKSRILEIGKFENSEPGNPESWTQKNKTKQNIKIEIHSAQNIGESRIAGTNKVLTLFWDTCGRFQHGHGFPRKNVMFAHFAYLTALEPV